MMAVLHAGAAGYIRKDADPKILLAAVRAVVRGKTYIDPSVARQFLQARAAALKRSVISLEELD